MRTVAFTMARKAFAQSVPSSSHFAVVRAFSSTGPMGKSGISVPSSSPKRTIDELARSIDTTLTPVQREHVEKIKRQIKGGSNSPRSLYRDVPRPDELTGVGNFLPKIADNAQELIDFALSHLPKKTGPKRSRFKQRLVLKALAKKKQDDRRREETMAAKLRHDAKLKKQRVLIKQYKEEAQRINSQKISASNSGATN